MSSVSIANETEEESSQVRITGRVKWFNNKAGFGFVTACEGDLKDKDVFVHYSSINVPDDQYKYLIQGEYVDFELNDSVKGDHEFHAANISGVKGGSLMCETRKLTLETRPYRPRVYKTPDESDTTHHVTRETRPVRRTNPPRQSNKENDRSSYTKQPVRKQRQTTETA
jgi:CspA family cold shock protein